jgi:hypothetical protein
VKFRGIRFSRFREKRVADRQTNRQTDRQATVITYIPKNAGIKKVQFNSSGEIKVLFFNK